MAVEAMADMLQHSIIAAKDLEAERQVILEEINMRDDDPGDLIHDVFAETVWGDHPLGRPVLGSRDTITGMKRDQVKRFYDRLYTPHHFVIAAAGNLEHDGLCRLIERRMDTGRKVTGTSRQLRTGGDAPVPMPATEVLRRTTEQAHISMGTNGYSRRDDERFAFGVVNSILGGGMSSRLFQEIREKRGMAYSVYSYHTMYTEAGLFSIYAGTTPSNAKEVVRVARGQMEDLASGGLTDEELERAKGHVRGSLVLSLEDTSGRMSRIGRGEISHGEIMSVDELIARTEAVTKEDAVAVAADVFSRPMALAVIGPFRKRDFAGDAGGSGGSEAVAARGGAPR
jgi:predicted Zn-dependent peptidase